MAINFEGIKDSVAVISVQQSDRICEYIGMKFKQRGEAADLQD